MPTTRRPREQIAGYIPAPTGASRFYTGHYAGLHPEDQPYLSEQLAARQRRQTHHAGRLAPPPRQVEDTDEDEDEDGTGEDEEEDLDYQDVDKSSYEPRYPRTSARKYRETTASYAIAPRGTQPSTPVTRRQMSPLPPARLPQPFATPPSGVRAFLFRLVSGLVVFLMIALAIVLVWNNIITPWWQVHSDDVTYGRPRTFQIDAIVGHGTPQFPASHFIALNDHGIIEVFESPTGIPQGSTLAQVQKMYHQYIIQILAPGRELLPVTLSFQDENGDGKPDMLVTVGEPGGTQNIFEWYNTGSAFTQQSLGK